MKAGPLKYKLQVLRLDITAGDYGDDVVSYTPTNIIYAERVKNIGRRSEEVSEHFPTYNVEFRVRSGHKISENWRVQQLGGYLYTVVAIEPNIELGMNTLICERVNE